MIDSQTKQKIIDSANILEVVSDFVSLRRAGVSYVGLCPFHNDRKPSFYVSPSKNVCKCFSCGEGGSPIHFVMKHEQMSYTEALRYLAKKYHIEIVEREETDEEKIAVSQRQSLMLVNDYAQRFFRTQLLEVEEGRNIGLSYLHERGIHDSMIELFGLGYSPESKDALTMQAVSDGYELEKLTQVGLSIQADDGRPPIDRFRGRIIFPIRNLSGQYVGFGGRVMGKIDKIAKYLNSPESPIYSKSRELYGLYQAKSSISKAGKCYLVEGYTDVISMHQCGITNVVASSGTALTHQQIRLLRRFTEHITVLYDGDSAGIRAAIRGIDLLLEEGLNIKVVLLPDGEDPDSYARHHSAEDFLTYLSASETDFIHFKIALYREEMLSDPIKRAELITDILKSIALIPDEIRRAVLIQNSALELRMSEQLLTNEVNKYRQKKAYTSSEKNFNPSPIQQPKSENPIEETKPQSNQLKLHEYDLVRLIIQMGLDTIYVHEDTEGQVAQYTSYMLADYVYKELELDGLLTEISPILHSVLTEILGVKEREKIDCTDFFLNHESEDIRHLSADLICMEMKIDKNNQDDAMEMMLLAEVANASTPTMQAKAIEELSQYKENKTLKANIDRGSRTIRELDNLRLAILMQNIYEVQKELIDAQKNGQEELLVQLIEELRELNTLKIQFAQNLGERTIVG